MTEGRKLTNKQLQELEEELEEEYLEAQRQMQKKIAKVTKQFEKEDKKKLQMLAKGAITAAQYGKWRREQLTQSQWSRDLVSLIAGNQTKVNERSAGIINSFTARVFTEGYYFGTYEVEKAAKVDTFFAPFSKDAVSRLLLDKPQLLPKAGIDIPLDKRWNERQMRYALSQSITRGESVNKLADRLQKAGMKPVTINDIKNRDKMTPAQIAKELERRNKNVAIRNARTMMTTAENAGKLESYRRAEKLGIKVKKMWSATMDDRTRDSHAFLDGVTIPLEEEFPNKCMYPGDVGGPAEEVWNCRCELSMQLDGFTRDPSDLTYRNVDRFPYDSYEEWKDAKQKAKMVELPKTQSPSGTQYKRVFDNADAYKCKSFDEYAKYVKKEFSATFDDSMRALNLDLVKDGTAGVETVLRDVSAINPNAVQELKLTIKEEAGGFMGTIPKQDMTMHLTFNGEVYKDEATILEYIKSGIDDGTFLEGTSPSTLGAHEAGHLIEWMIDKTQQDAHYAWRSCDVARDIVDEARKSVRNELERRRKAGASWDELILLEEKFNNVSKYASYSASEKMAEAFHDVYALRKSDASFFNKEVVRISLERLQQVT